MNITPRPFGEDLGNALRGLSMGCADVVPGVSGGTVALILGIYLRLVTAISRVDSNAGRLLLARKWREVADYLDLRFLITLGAGIGCGIVGMSLVVNHLLTHAASRSLTLAVFFGMIAASAVVLASLIRPESWAAAVPNLLLGVTAAVFACWASFLEHSTTGEPALWWLFCCGAIGICAMILPGISGAMILLVLGVYIHLTEIPRNLIAGRDVAENLLTLAVFGSGCGIGLVSFSKVLRWLLARHHNLTMSALCGFMVGALVKLWPFQRDLTPEIEKLKHKSFALYWPDLAEPITPVTFTFAVAAAIAVIAVHRWAEKH